jgi:hypothetical protein
MEFETTNNLAENEALLLGLRAAKDMKIEELSVFMDAELIFHQVINMYQAKNPRLRAYRNEVWDMIDSFFLAFNILFVPREENYVEDFLVVSTSNFKVLLSPKLKYEVEINYKPSIPNNVKHWKLFEDDMEIKKFFETVDEFLDMHIDKDQDSEEIPHANVSMDQIANHHIV